MTTKKRDLRTGKSVWTSYKSPAVVTGLARRAVKTDVLVIGAGISGALISEMLSAEGLQVAIVDRRGAIQGSTPASTALVQYEIDTPLIELSKKIGANNAMRAWRRSRLGLEGLAQRTRELKIACDATRRDSLYLSGNILSAAELRNECDARRQIGFETLYLNRSELRERYRFERSAGLLSFDNLAVNPRQLAACYLRVALSRGVRVYAPEEIETMESGGGCVIAVSKTGATFSARSVVYASGYELPKIVRSRSLSIASTWALATPPQRRNLWLTEALIWEASDPYLYLRTTPDGRIICGGEDESFSDEERRDAKLPQKIARIRAKLKKLMPWVNTTAEFQWCASFGISSTGLPRIGLVPGHRNVYAALGYGGNGITFSRVAAEILTNQITGRKDPEADLFRF